MAFWWCIAHSSVEGSASDDTGCANLDRLGPYDSREQASQALESTRARTAAEDARDAADDEWGKR